MTENPLRQHLGLLNGLIGVLIFSATLPLTRIAVTALDPWFVTFGRTGLAGLCALVLLAVLRLPPPPRDEWGRYLLAMLCVCIGFPGCVGLAMQSVPAGHGGVVIGIIPLATALTAALLHGDRPAPSFWLCAIAGAVVVTVFALWDGMAGGFALGDLYLVGAVGAAALGYTLQAGLTRQRPGWEVISWVMVAALPIVLPGTLWFWPPSGWAPIPASVVWSFLYLAMFSQFIGFFFWNAGLAMGGVARTSQVQLLQTFFTLAIAALIAGETPGPATWAAAVLVVALVALSRRLSA